MTERERARRVKRYGAMLSEAEALYCAAEILDRWENLSTLARQLRENAERLEQRAWGEVSSI